MSINWKKSLLVVADIALAGYLLVAITAFTEPYELGQVCSQVNIDVSDGSENGFLNADETKALLKRLKLYPLGKRMVDIDVRQMEEALCKSPFVNKAQCYKTSGGHVCILLSQRTPVMRVKADNGDDYYVDNKGGVMPNTKYVADITIATGAISRKYAQKVLAGLGNVIAADDFWKEQVVQVNVLADGTVELVPRVGDHIVYLGRPVDVERKLARMVKFYKYGLGKAGWNRYSTISVEFDNQIICKKKNNVTHE